jgi:hypothetical protein
MSVDDLDISPLRDAIRQATADARAVRQSPTMLALAELLIYLRHHPDDFGPARDFVTTERIKKEGPDSLARYLQIVDQLEARATKEQTNQHAHP